jgi:hypothetical protein
MTDKPAKPRGRPARIKDGIPLSTRVSTRHYDRISAVAIRDKKSVSELVRQVIIRSPRFRIDK